METGTVYGIDVVEVRLLILYLVRVFDNFKTSVVVMITEDTIVGAVLIDTVVSVKVVDSVRTSLLVFTSVTVFGTS